MSMKIKKSLGLDGIDAITIKNNINVFIPVFDSIFNWSLKEGIFLIFKSGDRER